MIVAFFLFIGDYMMINKQYPYDIAYGWLGNVADDGSGVIAITNVCLMNHMSIDVEDILNVIDRTYHPRLFFGRLGTNPFAIKRILKKCGFKVKFRGFLHNRMDLDEHNAYIVLYFWKDWFAVGARYQAGRVGRNGRLRLFNPYHQYDNIKQMKKFEEMILPVVFTID